MSYRFLLLGPPLLLKKGATLKVDTRKASALLAYLVMDEQTFQRDTLAAFLWPDLDQSRARAALRRTLTPLNKALGKDALLTDRETVALNPDFDLWVDNREFEGLVDSCLEHGHSAGEFCSDCLEPLSQAAELVRGDFMEGFSLRDSAAFDDWQFEQADRLRRRYAHVLENLAECHASRQEFEAAIEYAHLWLGLDPLHEPAHRALMSLYARSGDRSGALQQYRACVRTLDEELGVPPLEETSRLYEEILEGRYTAVPQASLQTLPRPRTRPEAPPLVGRESEWADILDRYRQAEAAGRFVVIEGEIGIGKTRLAQEVVGYARSEGGHPLTARCYRGENQLAYAPFISALQDLAHGPAGQSAYRQLPAIWQSAVSLLLPELTAEPPEKPSPAPQGGPASQSLLFEAVRQLITNFSRDQPPGLLLIDDLQWADLASLDLLTYLVRRLQEMPLLVIAIWRSNDVSTGHPLQTLLSESLRSGAAAHFHLDRLSPEEVETLAAHFPEAPESLRSRLYQETEGLPFFIIEYLLNAPDLAGDSGAIPRSIHDIQLARLSGLTEAENQLLTTAAVIGRSVDYDTLREASGRSEEEAVNALDGLLAKNLLVERNGESRRGQETPHGPSYDFTHETLYRVVYDQTSMARRRLLHRRAAEALTRYSRTAAAPGAQAAQIARHLQLAGQEARAAEFFMQAGNYARSLFANDEALSHYNAALALGHPDSGGLQEAIGDLLTLNGNYRAASAAFETAAALAPADKIARLEQKLGNLHHRRGDFDLAAGHFKAALDFLNGDQPGLKAEIFADWSRTEARRGDFSLGQELAQKGLDLAASQADDYALGQAHNILGIIARVRGKATEALDHLEKALAAAGDHPFARAAALNNLALVQRDAQNYPAAAELAQEALTLCVRLGDRHREAALRNHLADIYHAAGDERKAMAYLKQAVEIFAEIGLDAGDLQPEIWKLTEW